MSAAEVGPAGSLELLVDRRDDTIVLRSPGVGLFVAGCAQGDALTAGATAGELLVLGRAVTLLVPAAVDGRVSSPGFPLARQPVGWGDLLYELRPFADAAARDSQEAPARGSAPRPASSPTTSGSRLIFSSPQSGRFYLRPSPEEAPFVAPNELIEDGRPIGLLEVMKTFAHVLYATGGALPARARVVAVLVDDGADVAAGDALLEVEPAPSVD